MIKRLRIKFVCINMIIVTIMLCVIFGLVFHFTSTNLERKSIEMMQAVAMEPMRPGPPGKERPEEIMVPYFTIQMRPGSELYISDNEYFDLSDKEMLEELLLLSTDQNFGVLPDYALRYLRVTTPREQVIVFADMSNEISVINNLRQNCLIIGSISFILFLIISIVLANWAVRPVETAWEQQRQFVADASHELKTPLTVMLSNIQMLIGNGEDRELREKLTDNLMTVAEQMKQLVIKLLDSAQVDQGASAMHFSSINLSNIVSNTLLTFDSFFYEQGLELDSSIQENIWIKGSSPHLVQLLDILLDNAQKYSRIQGRTYVSLHSHNAKSCLLAVANEGDPLSNKERKDIFRRFYRVDDSRTRTGSYGLGLSIAEGIVKTHKGRIWAECKDGVNTFFVRLPTAVKRENSEE